MLVVAACGIPAGTYADLSAIGGVDQSATVGSALAKPFVILVIDSGGPISDVFVEFVVTAGSGMLSANTVTTDADGEAQATLTLGPTAGTNVVEAQASEVPASPVEFSATGIAGAVTQILVTAGDGQSAPAGSPLPSPLVVTIEDIDDNPVAGTTVDFVVTEGGGAVMPASVATDADGRAQATLTLGTTSGANTVEADVMGVPAVAVFSATGL